MVNYVEDHCRFRALFSSIIMLTRLSMVYIAVLVCTHFLFALISPFRITSLLSLTCQIVCSHPSWVLDCIILEISILEKRVSYVTVNEKKDHSAQKLNF